MGEGRGIYSVAMFHVGASSRHCSSFPNRTRCAGLRFGFGCKLGNCLHLYCCDVPRIPNAIAFGIFSYYSFCLLSVLEKASVGQAIEPKKLRCTGHHRYHVEMISTSCPLQEKVKAFAVEIIKRWRDGYFLSDREREIQLQSMRCYPE